MNLVLSGPIDPELITAIESVTRPARSVPVRTSALRFEEVDHSPEVRTTTRALCDSRRVDHAFVTTEQRLRNFRLLAIDMDSTLINIECIDELAEIAGVGREVKAITEAAMRGEIVDFASSLRQRVRLLAGLHVDALRQVYEERLQLTQGARELISEAKSTGVRTLLLSGGFTYFTERLKTKLSFDNAHANTLEILNLTLTGYVREPIFDAKSKAAAVSEELRLLRAAPHLALIIGDGANDIPMMSLTLNSVAYHAKPEVRDAAFTNVRFGGLEVVLDYFG